MQNPTTVGAQVRIFSGAGIHGQDGTETKVNQWLAANPLAIVHSLQIAIGSAGQVVVMAHFSGLASG